MIKLKNVFIANREKIDSFGVATPYEISYFSNVSYPKILRFCQKKLHATSRELAIKDYYLDTPQYSLHKNNSSLRIRLFLTNQQKPLTIIHIKGNEDLLNYTQHLNLRRDLIYVQEFKKKSDQDLKNLINEYRKRGFYNFYTLKKTCSIYDLIPRTPMEAKNNQQLLLKTNFKVPWKYQNMGLRIQIEKISQPISHYKKIIEIEFDETYQKKGNSLRYLFEKQYGKALINKPFHKVNFVLNNKIHMS